MWHPQPTEALLAHAQRQFRREVHELRTVRGWVGAELESQRTGSSVGFDLVLVADELVANVIEHTSSEPTVHLGFYADEVALWVVDDSRAEPVLLPADTSRTRGNGLRLVQGCSTSWGVHRTPTGKAVWVLVPRE